ncbi:hypothetical protein vseg_007103 [Gypsophila vaccaria]
MYKQSPSRNHRSKGIKPKHILQICLLLAVCCWLIYQVKHSQDKRKEFSANDEKVVDKLQKDSEIVRFGRKDLPRTSEIATGGDKHTEDDDEKEAEEEEEIKHDEDEPEKEDEIVGERDEEKGSGDDETDENEEELKEAEHKHAEEQVDEDSDREDGEEDLDESHAENEAKELPGKEEHLESGENEDAEKEDLPKIEENRDVSTEDDNDTDALSNGQGHGIDNADRHEEREEPYKADDASSEVANHVQNIIPETENVTKAHANSIFGKANIVQENETKSSDNPDALTKTAVESKNGRNGNSSNLTSLAKEHPSVSNGTQTAVSANVSLNAGTGNTPIDKDPNVLSKVLGDNTKPKLATDESVKSEASGNSNKTENAHTDVKESLGSSRMGVDSQKADDTDTTGAEKYSSAGDGDRDDKLEKNGAGESDERSSSSEGASSHDPIDESDFNLTDEEKETRVDTETLPDINTNTQKAEEVMML